MNDFTSHVMHQAIVQQFNGTVHVVVDLGEVQRGPFGHRDRDMAFHVVLGFAIAGEFNPDAGGWRVEQPLQGFDNLFGNLVFEGIREFKIMTADMRVHSLISPALSGR